MSTLHEFVERPCRITEHFGTGSKLTAWLGIDLIDDVEFMEENSSFRSIQEIRDILTNALTCPGGEMVRSIAVGATEILDPVTGTFVGMTNDISLKYIIEEYCMIRHGTIHLLIIGGKTRWDYI